VDSLAVGRFGDDRDTVLEAPAQQDQCGCPSRPLRDPVHSLAGEFPAGSEGTVGLKRDALPLTGAEQRAAVLQRAELRLVTAGRIVPAATTSASSLALKAQRTRHGDSFPVT
jgi:hypothetical protein